MTNTPAAQNTPKRVELDKEVRFAVVMYGGVSLAIYINGVAQEFLRMVRATAELDARLGSGNRLPIDGNKFKITDTERVYRKVSYLLADENLQKMPPQECLEELESRVRSNETINLQFKVDILSGTSAGGINAIYLAKALANDQDISQLKNLWVSEGDIAALLNDQRSVEQPFTLKEPPASLLNSQRMYDKLLKALDGMGEGHQPIDQSPYVDELDLFITTTDIQGVTLPIRLADKLVYERRHRNVFHFRYSELDGNDFASCNNPFLAYAARCTSAFPLAFEPMTLCDIDEVVAANPHYAGRDECRSKNKEWEKFFLDYVDPKIPSRISFQDRAFGDGGYLDNKPFSYATETLQQRLADVPVDRKLMYIEPSPEHPESERQKTGVPNPIENAQAALLTIPRYETIREDLQRVLERNRLIQRVNRILSGVESDVEESRKSGRSAPEVDQDKVEQFGQNYNLTSSPSKPLEDEEWARLDLGDMVARKGRGYAAYHRLEISAVTEELARLITMSIGFDEKSDYLLAIHSLLRAWRDRTYTDHRKEEEKYLPEDQKMPTMNRFLLDFDIAYPLRRIKFVKLKIDQLYRMPEDQLNDEVTKILNLRGASQNEVRVSDRAAFKQELKSLKEALNKVYKGLRARHRLLWARPGSNSSSNGEATPNNKNPLLKGIADLKLNREVLEEILGKRQQRADATDLKSKGYVPVDEECKSRAVEFLKREQRAAAKLTEGGKRLGRRIGGRNRAANRAILKCLKVNNTLNDEASIARRCIGYYYQFYDDYDQVIFPILYSTGVGEADVVEVFRVSPEDAVALVDETKCGCKKLAGEALAHFGAFFDRLWRENDILWGRLDGAERIITALLQTSPMVARALVGEAQAAIVCEEIASRGVRETKQLLAESFMRTASGEPQKSAITEFVKNLKKNATPELKKRLRNVNGKQLRDFYEETFEEARRLRPKPALETAARATTVFGKVFQGISAEYDNRGDRAAVWIIRLGRVFAGLVEIAVPHSIPNIVFFHWLKLIYLFEVLMIIGGVFFSTPTRNFGWMALAVTLIVNGTVLLLTDIMAHKLQRWRVTRAVLVVFFILLVGLGLLGLPYLVSQVRSSYEDGTMMKWLVEVNGVLALLTLGFPVYMASQSGLKSKKNKNEADGETETRSLIRDEDRNEEVVAHRQAVDARQEEAPDKKTAPTLGIWMRVKSAKDVEMVVGGLWDHRRQKMRESLMMDNVFIIIYWLFFIGMSILLYSSVSNARYTINGITLGQKTAIALAAASAILATAAATFDWLENHHTLILLDTKLEKTDLKMLKGIRRASIYKFVLTFITIMTLSSMFVVHHGLVSTIGWVFLSSAFVGLLGVIAVFVKPSYRLIELAFLLFGIGLTMIAVSFTIWHEEFFTRIYLP